MSSRNRHARELEEQAKLLQALRDEQERLRDEQEKMKGNEKRICAKIEQYMRASAKLVKEEASLESTTQNYAGRRV